jgi:hypothetical protein
MILEFPWKDKLLDYLEDKVPRRVVDNLWHGNYYRIQTLEVSPNLSDWYFELFKFCSFREVPLNHSLSIDDLKGRAAEVLKLFLS